ncbi:branched-chain amino acid ABC transporter permease [Phreatobacter aquaticus]|uniref:Branched-chain amino acid ABC transporter permease n=1 Tax=Phreatobacter aquaticus TaxID=2570229 RepID=A0A4D7QFE6_9HYPH|nr:branched-chain amino acid ABC transporter permease [Phreatobacter aquaticus]QCK85371.1 branched-chain amino acid ABC transporter permease [Phreatobacter aquaticus]
MLPTGIHFESYAAETRVLKTLRSRIWASALALGLLCAPLFAGAYLLGVASEMFITLMAVYGLYVTVGMAGQINIAQSAFVGIGAFAAAKLSSYGQPVFVVIPLAALAAGCVSILFALPAVRVKGLYLALTTLAAQAMFPIVIYALPASWLGGLAGMPVEPLTLFGADLGTPTGFYYFTLALVALLTISAFRLQHSRFGRAMMAVRDNDIAAEVMGIPVMRVKLMAFFVGSLFAGVAGACLAYFLQFVTAASFTLFASVWYLGMLIVGGLHSRLGPILGVVFITVLQEGLHKVANTLMQAGSGSGGMLFALTSIILGGCILLALIFEPRGLAHRWAVLRNAFQIWPFPRN